MGTIDLRGDGVNRNGDRLPVYCSADRRSQGILERKIPRNPGDGGQPRPSKHTLGLWGSFATLNCPTVQLHNHNRTFHLLQKADIFTCY